MAAVTLTAVRLVLDGETAVPDPDEFADGDSLTGPHIGRGGLLLVVTSTEAEDAGVLTVHRQPSRAGGDQTVAVPAGGTVALRLTEAAEYGGTPVMSADFDGTAVAYVC